ncbi:hypothetical protein HYH03_008603 [Edaphochlamys debaryana]|uniref:Uncharacterized protein n=1 Tax=Edaphochlamys debaryana TaxID=47281 RepID=A0A836BZ99_9CHLO|nr:hypothetical protein HYH03_008603 [Edaphochlamys debaryana]|eukprot:KAG2493183.1 hypothetical protein HYH03_008603 [Edaphochlamys debaryana]
MKSGGMPSSHTALVMGLTTAVAVEHGTSSTVFAICLVLSAIIMYDATGVRLHAGRQATVLNIIIAEMPPDHPVQDGGRLRDSLGHTPIQVAVGALVGMAVGFFVQSMYMLGRAVDGENGGAGGAGGSFASQAAAAAAAAMGSSGGGSLGPPSSA